MMVTHDSVSSGVNKYRTKTFGPVGLVVGVGASSSGTIIEVIWCKESFARNINTRAVRVVSQ